jgi:hypothetical protein
VELLTTEPVSANPKGYWENKEITVINDAILRRYKGKWDEPPQLAEHWEHEPSLGDLKRKACELIDERFRGKQLWGFKDPRTCLTLPFWQGLLPEMRYVICLRHPLSVATSLARRDNFTAEKSNYLWLKYVSSALKYAPSGSSTVVFYRDLIEECEQSLLRLSAFMGVECEPDTLNLAHEFVEPELQHHHEEPKSVQSKSEVEACARSLYNSMRDGNWPDVTKLTELEPLLQRMRNGSRSRFFGGWRSWKPGSLS